MSDPVPVVPLLEILDRGHHEEVGVDLLLVVLMSIWSSLLSLLLVVVVV